MSIAGDVLKPKTSGPTAQAQDCKIFYHLFKINLFNVQKYCQATGTGTWDLGPGTWDLGPGT